MASPTTFWDGTMLDLMRNSIYSRDELRVHISTGYITTYDWAKKKKVHKVGSPRAILVALRTETENELRPIIKRMRKYL